MSAYRQGYLHPIPKAVAGTGSSAPPPLSLYEPIYVSADPVTTMAGDVLLGLTVIPA